MVEDINGRWHSEGAISESRVCRWKNVDNGGYPDWAKVIADVALLDIGVTEEQLRTGLHKFSQRFIHIPAMLKECAVDDNLIKRVGGRIDHVMQSLESL